MARRKKQTEATPQQPEGDAFAFDIGGFDSIDFDIEGFDLGGLGETEADVSSRYIKPKLDLVKERQVIFDNAVSFADCIKIGFGERYDAIVGGGFIFGDFIEAFLVKNNCRCLRMIISTLSMSQDNIDSLHNLMEGGYIDRLDLIVSDYFYSHERRCLVPYACDRLDIGDKFQLAVTRTHTKTVQFHTLGGRKIVMHGSANLRSSGNIEQFTIEENPELYDFYEEYFDPIIRESGIIDMTQPKEQ